MSEEKAVIQGQIVDWRNVAAHKSLRVYIDIPTEMRVAFFERFGAPTATEPVPVAIARLAVE